MRYAAGIICALSMALALALPARTAWGDGDAQGRMKFLTQKKEPVNIQADRVEYDRKTDDFNAVGNVNITQGASTLTADKVTLNQTSGNAEATGNARLVTDGNVLFAERMKVNFNTRLGVIQNGKFFVQKGNYHITGASVERAGENEYVAVDATLTTCDAEAPFWKASASRLDIRMDKDVTARDVVFRIKDVPVLYSPYAWFPLLKPRTSGLLLPGMGYSTKDGTRLIESFYWAPVDNFDATVTADFRSQRGVGVGAELRLALDKDTSTNLNGYFMDDHKAGENRYNLSLKHQEKFTDSLSGRLDLNISDRQFYRDLTETAKDRTQRSIDSNAFVANRWDWGEGYIFSQYTKSLDLNDDVTVQRLPELGFDVYKKQLFDVPVYLDMEGSAAYFYKKTGVRGGRFDLFPKFSGAFNLGGINITPKVGYRETVYDLGRDGADGFDDERGLFGAGVSAQTGLFKRYSFDSGMLEGIRHTLEPMVAYNYVLRRGGTNIPKFDGLDTFGRKDMLAYSLTNRFVIKYRETGDHPRVDYVTLRLGQFMDFYGDNGPSVEKRKLSNLYGELTYKASVTVTLKNDFRYDFASGGLPSVDTDIRYTDRQDRWYVGLGQRFSKDTEPTFMSPSRFDFFTPSTDFVSDFVLTNAAADERVNFLTGEAGAKITDNWKVDGKLWYDIHTHDLRETDLSATYMSQCWGLTFSFTERPGGRQIMAMLKLKGLGNVKI